MYYRKQIGGETKIKMATTQSRFDWDTPEETDYAEVHDFDSEPIIEGVLVRFDTVTIKGKDVSLVELETAKGNETVWLGAVLKSIFENKLPSVGDYVGIRYLGMVKGGSGYKYRDFDVRVIRKED